MSENSVSFTVGVDEAPKVVEDWRGASGMPICAVRSSKILGIACEVPPKMGTNVLKAVPTWKLLQEPAFRVALGFDDRNKRRASYEWQLAAALGKSAKAIDTIRETGGLADAMTAEALAACLLDMTDPEQVAGVLHDAYDALETECEVTDTPELRTALTAIEAAVQYVVPCQCDLGVVETIRPTLSPEPRWRKSTALWRWSPKSSWLAPESVGPSSVRESMRTTFLKGSDNCLSHLTLESKGQDRRRDDIREALTRKYQVGTWNQTRNQIDDILIERFAATSGAMKRPGNKA